MSNTVDNRAVELQFVNKEFESGVKTSMDSIAALKKSLNFDETSKSLTNLGTVGKSFSLENIASNIQSLSERFSTLGIIGMTVIQNLTNTALQYGKKIADALITPMKTGLEEYETQINAVQTILANTASKGTNIEDVNAALDELNTYADKTIYNFTEMTRNIGTFTAAGVELDTSVSAIKGIANLAAVSGSNSQQAATGMYQLSQAISSGTVKLMDWNSVVNAGMGGQVFQDALKETARVHNVEVDGMIEKAGSFRDSLKEGWITSEILLETLAKFTGDLTEDQLRSIGYSEEQIAAIVKLGQTANDAATKVKTFTQLKDTLAEALQSGWSQSWRIIIGDFEEAKAFFTEVSDTLGPIIQSSSDARNKILQEWADLGGRKDLIDALRNSFQALTSIVKPIGEAFREVFPPITGVHLATLTRLLKEFTERLKIGGATADKIKIIFKGIFSVIDILRIGIVSLAKAFLSLFKGVNLPTSGGILDFFANIGQYLSNIRDFIKLNDSFTVGLQNLGLWIKFLASNVMTFLQELGSRLAPVSTEITKLFNKIDLTKIQEFFNKFKFDLSKENIFAQLESFVTNIKERISATLEKLSPILDAVKNSFWSFVDAISLGISNIIGGSSQLAQKATGPLSIFGKIFEKVKENLQGIDTGKIGEFFSGIGSYITDAVSKIDFKKIVAIISGGLIGSLILAIRKFITQGSEVFGGFSEILSGVSGILDGVRGSLEAWQQNLKAKTLLTIAAAIGILAAALIALSFIDPKKLLVSTGAITALFADLMGSMAVFSKFSSAKGATSALGLVAISVAILIIAGAMAKIAEIDESKVKSGISGILSLTFGLVAISLAMSRNTTSITKGSLGILAISVSLHVLVGVIKRMGEIDYQKMKQGLQGVGLVLFELAAFMKVVDFDKIGLGKGLGLLALVGAVLAMSFAVEKFGNMDVGAMKQGLIAIGAVLTELGLFTRLASSGKNLITTSIGLVILTGALFLITDVLERMAKMSWEEIGKGLVVLGGSMLILSLALNAMQGTLLGSAALLVAAIALGLLVPVLQALGSMELEQIGIALLAMAGVFLVIGLAGLILTPVVPVLLGFGAALLLIGIASALVGAGLMLFSVGLVAIAASGTAAALVIAGMVVIFAGLVPIIVTALIEGLKTFTQGIIDNTPLIKEAITNFMNMVLDVINETAPKLIKTLGTLLSDLINLIVTKIPEFVDAVLELIAQLLQSIAEKIPEFVQSGFDILIGFLTGIRDNIKEVVTVTIEIVTEFLDGVAEQLPDIIESGFNLMLSFINGLADSIEKNAGLINESALRLAGAIVKGLTDGLTSGVGGVIAAIKRLGGAAIDALKTLLGIFSPSKVFSKIGTFVPLGFVEGMLKYADRIEVTSKKLGNRAIDGMSNAISTINTSLLDNLDTTPTIKPVVDLADVISGAKQIDKVIGRNAFNVIPAMSTASLISNGLGSNYISGNSQTSVPSVISLTQNNYSPKALSRLEIYRQTKNQLLTLKGLV